MAEDGHHRDELTVPGGSLYHVHETNFLRLVDDMELTNLRAQIGAFNFFLEQCGPALANLLGARSFSVSSLVREARPQAQLWWLRDQPSVLRYITRASAFFLLHTTSSPYALTANRSIMVDVYLITFEANHLLNLV